MAQSELDGFYVKFKNLLRSEKDATLTIKSESGRTVVTLSVDLGHVLSEPGLHHYHHQPRNGPARQRRLEKRAAERNVIAGKASATRNVDKITTSSNNNESAEKALVDTKEVTEEETLVPTKLKML